MQEEFGEKINKEDNQDNQSLSKNKAENKRTAILNVSLIIIIFLGLFIYMLKVDGMENIIHVLNSVDYRWVLAGLICLIMHWLCESLNLHIPIKKIYQDQKFTNSIKVSMIGQLFNNITPFSSGGQPMQAYELNKTGKRVSDSLSAMAIKFIITQTALVVSTLVVVILEFEFFKTLMQDYLWIAIIGFMVNIIAILVMILAGIKKGMIVYITNPIVRLLGKIHVLKNTEQKIEKLNASIDNFSNQFIIMKSEKIMVVKMFLIAVVQSLVYYSITYMVYRAFGNYGVSFLQIIPTQAFLLLIMTFIPTPGSGLGAEGGFYLLFNSIFQNGTIHMSILFWRMYTFYLPIIIGALFLIPIVPLVSKKERMKKWKHLLL